MNIRTRHIQGVWESSDPAYGIFWGLKQPSWNTANFDAQWQGIFVVTGGVDTGSILNAQVNINSNGDVTGSGSIVNTEVGNITGGNITISEGSLAFSNLTIGGFNGSFTGKQRGDNVTVNMSTPSLPETASMGVYHGRLVGKFSISTNGDSGYYILYKNSNS